MLFLRTFYLVRIPKWMRTNKQGSVQRHNTGEIAKSTALAPQGAGDEAPFVDGNYLVRIPKWMRTNKQPSIRRQKSGPFRAAKYLVSVLVGALGCAGEKPESADLHATHLGQTLKGKGNAHGKDKTLTAGLSMTDGHGKPIVFKQGHTEVFVETRTQGGDWKQARDVEIDFNSPPLVDVMIVADNSGSLEEHLGKMQTAIRHFSHVMLTRAHPDRVGLVRVSTEASILSPLVESDRDLAPAIDEMFINRGWTALWDGIRLAGEVLEGQRLERSQERNCFAGSYASVVVFTDGADNNSADEHETSYEGDGIDTTLGDLSQLQVGGLPTPVHTVAVGSEADEGSLIELSDATGGHHTSIQTYGQLVGALRQNAAKLEAVTPLCFQPASCDDDQARLTVSIEKKGKTRLAEKVLRLPDFECEM